MSATTRVLVTATATADSSDDAYYTALMEAEATHPGQELFLHKETNDGATYTFQWWVR